MKEIGSIVTRAPMFDEPAITPEIVDGRLNLFSIVVKELLMKPVQTMPEINLFKFSVFRVRHRLKLKLF